MSNCEFWIYWMVNNMTETFLFTSNFVLKETLALNTIKLTERSITEKVSISADEYKHFGCWIKKKNIIDTEFQYICTSIVITWGYNYLHYKLSKVHINSVPSNIQNKTNNTAEEKQTRKATYGVTQKSQLM